VGSAGAVFPLVARRRVAGLAPGTLPSRRRGQGLDTAGSRLYRPGDDVRLIDRHASARLSATTDQDLLVVREHLTDETARVVVLVDGRPSMTARLDGVPWLSKPEAARSICELVARSAAGARCPVELPASAPGAGGEPLEAALQALATRDRPPRPGSFVFAVSDFLELPAEEAWREGLSHRWDVVPVIVQDPIWEQSFPPVGGVSLELLDPASGRLVAARFTRGEAEERRREHEERLVRIQAALSALGLDWVLVSGSDPGDVLASFQAWATGRMNGSRLR
jgi:uncharacterized protein (DUF58 family)